MYISNPNLINMSVRERLISQMPTRLRTAQEAIALPEVQEILKQLAKYNLGVCMPHIHTADEDFADLPNDLVQVEENLEITFKPRQSMDNSRAVPVAWQWLDDGVTASAMCVGYCTPTHRQSGGEAHKTLHNRV